MQRVFGAGGVIDSFVSQRLDRLIDRDGPVWRWVRDDPLTAGLDPASPQDFAKAVQVRDLMITGVPIKVALVSKSPGIGEVEFSAGGTTYKFEEPGARGRNLVWSGSGSLPEAHVSFFPPVTEGATTTKVEEMARIETEGPWALFRLIDMGEMTNSGANAITEVFASKGETAKFAITLPGSNNPFSRGGLWSFRCPIAL